MNEQMTTFEEAPVIAGIKKTYIKITYRHIINAGTGNIFENQIHQHSYDEFLLKSQVYNPHGKFKTFTELKANDGRANSLHYKSGFAISGFISLLKNKIPFLEDNCGKPVAFDEYRFEIIESDITDQQKHIVALYFTTPVLVLKRSFSNYLVLKEEKFDGNDDHETFTLPLQPNVSVVYYEEKD